MLERFEKLNGRVSGWFESIGLAALLFMMLLTCIDVIGAKLFLRPVFGALDVVMLAQIVAISFAAASALLLGRHVQVEFFVVILPKRLQAVIDSIMQLFGLGLFIVIIWRLSVLGHNFQVGGEGSATARIPLYPFAYGIALASIPVCLVLLFQFLSAIGRMVKR
jgi:TRAP-type C4-dicarboxylate transport system permease small subunit